jgi:hypothetical protein
MPRLCACGARARADLSCSTESCPSFRASRRGVTLNKRPTRRLRSKQLLRVLDCQRVKRHGAKIRACPPDGELREGADALAASSTGEASASSPALAPLGQPEVFLRAADLEHMLVDLFGLPGHFAILAVAFRRAACPQRSRAPKHPHARVPTPGPAPTHTWVLLHNA